MSNTSLVLLQRFKKALMQLESLTPQIVVKITSVYFPLVESNVIFKVFRRFISSESESSRKGFSAMLLSRNAPRRYIVVS